jgi:predicted kinase
MEKLVNYLKINQPFVLVMVGPPLSGKSTYINKLKEFLDFRVISRDDIIMELSDSNDYNEAFKSVNQKLVDDILKQRFFEYSTSGENIIIDMTNLTSRRRRNNLTYFSSEYTKVALVFPIISFDDYVIRNDKRKKEENKNISPSIWNDMANNFQTIKKDEGFDKVFSL